MAKKSAAEKELEKMLESEEVAEKKASSKRSSGKKSSGKKSSGKKSAGKGKGKGKGKKPAMSEKEKKMNYYLGWKEHWEGELKKAKGKEKDNIENKIYVIEKKIAMLKKGDVPGRYEKIIDWRHGGKKLKD